MSQSDLIELRRFFERCLEQPADQREALARRLCREQPQLLDELLSLLERDQAIDTAGIRAESGLAGLRQLALPEALMKGQCVGTFRIEACIGSGGMGSIYRASRAEGDIDQQVALKLLRPDVINPALLGRFSNERRLLASLNHPGICRFLDAGQIDDGRPYVAMELIEGTPIIKYCDRNRLGLHARLGLFRKVLDAVAYAHSRLVVHRDVKSGNILVTRDGEPRLLDFGIAKSLEPGQPSLTQTSDRYLTPASAAPEQYLGEPAGTACDIYALGQLLYELLCGLPPFEFAGATAGQVERMLLEQPPPSPASRCLGGPPEAARTRGFAGPGELRRHLSGDLEAITLKCLRKSPGERYNSVEQLDRDIARVLKQRPILARRGERWYRLKKFVSRNRLPVGLSAALTIILTISVTVIISQAVQVNAQRDQALIERDRARYAVDTLKKAFVAADPARVMGASVTARQILDSAREPLDATFDSEPELFASLAEVLAEVKLELMLDDAAASLAQRGIEAGQRAGIPEGDLRSLWLLLARARTDSNDRQAALAALDKVRALDGEPRADRLYARGRWLLLDNNPEAAIEQLFRARRAGETEALPVELRVRIHSQLGLAQSMAGQHRVSLKTFDDLLASLATDQNSRHSQVTLTRFRRVDALRRAGELEQAREEAAAVMHDVIDWYGPDSAMAGRVHGSLGLLHGAMGDREQAAEHTQRAYDIWLAALGADHPNVLRSVINLAQQLEGVESRISEAEHWYRKALEISSKRFGPTNRTSHTIRAHLARFLARQGRASEAIELMMESGMAEQVTRNPAPSWERVYQETLQLTGCAGQTPPGITAEDCQRLLDPAPGAASRSSSQER